MQSPVLNLGAKNIVKIMSLLKIYTSHGILRYTSLKCDIYLYLSINVLYIYTYTHKLFLACEVEAAGGFTGKLTI
jgi:hypothetical protein